VIARISDDEGVFATLGDNLRWTAGGSPTEDALNDLLDTCERSPAIGDWIVVHVTAMAKVFGGTAEFARPIDDTPGRIY
jgi:hypothetical protein